MDNKKQWFEKHNRYLKFEAQARIKNKRPVSLFKLIAAPLYYFCQSFFLKNGYKSLTGFYLSIYWSWYQTTAIFLHIKKKFKNG
jgi:hypothetical protein